MMFLSFCTGSSLTDCSHLPPEQRRKKLLARIKNLNEEIQREREQSYRGRGVARVWAVPALVWAGAGTVCLSPP
ncbi:hypothetical protein AMECASPLE_034943 [Ameca splendens]|uniref:TOCA HR1 domain-containing protein n=1 Tax=Ameca splendens TaxID=208324 RepID=A0ABV0ZU97_9TELE